MAAPAFQAAIGIASEAVPTLAAFGLTPPTYAATGMLTKSHTPKRDGDELDRRRRAMQGKPA